VISSGGESLKKCYQCATCSVVCNVTPEESPFPRKEMVQAQWGLKDELFRNPDIWLCHQCSDCTAYCPRGAKPGEVLNAIRRLSIKKYSKPSFLASMAGDARYAVLLFAFPVVILLAILSGLGHLGFLAGQDQGRIVFSKMMPIPAIDITFTTALLFALAMLARGVYSYWNDMAGGSKPGKIPFGAALASTVKDIIVHKRFDKCEATNSRKSTHMFLFFSFIGLTVTTGWAIMYLYGHEIFGIEKFAVFNFGDSPYPFSDPLKWLANASAAALLLGVVLLIVNRLKNGPKLGGGSYYDWFLIFIISGLCLSGICSEGFRVAGAPALAYPTYLVHLVFIFVLFAYAPFSKMAHMFYRATAMVFARAAGREQ
jgi:quinone-modifying oxidoreductase subunit QmoC